MNKQQVNNIQKIVISIYKKDIDSLYKVLMIMSEKYGYSYKEIKKEFKFKKDLEKYLIKTDDTKITSWFMEMAIIFMDNNLYVGDYFYGFAKTFLIVDGITKFNKNEILGNDLLFKQLEQYYITKKMDEFKEQFIDELKINKKILNSITKNSKDNILEIMNAILSS